MRIILVRHAIAVDAASAGVPDVDRPLTPEGEKKFELAAMGLAAICGQPDIILTSPLRRAVETAAIAAVAWNGRTETVPVRREPLLAGGDLDDLGRSLAGLSAESTVVLVGHEPHIAWFLAWLIGAGEGRNLQFRKGGAALVETAGVKAGAGRLVWYLPPRVLRLIGRS